MLARLARGYTILLAAALVVLFAAGVVVHLSMFAGASEFAKRFCGPLWTVSLLVVIPAMAYVKDSLYWTRQVKACPDWMWRSAFVIWVYGFVVFALRLIFPAASSPMADPLILSGIPLGFEAITICILYAALWRGALDSTGIEKRTLHSLVIAALVVAGFSGLFPRR